MVESEPRNSRQNSHPLASNAEKGVAADCINYGCAAPDRTAPNDTSDTADYSVYTPVKKRWLCAIASLAALFSPLSANIYYSATTTLARELNTSITNINLTVTCYLIFQGLAPTFAGGLSDKIGRRPVYLICFLLYIPANIGLALQTDYAALFVLRCLQSAGGSGTVALAYGLVSDIITSAQRGSYASYVTLGAMIGPSLGPTIGGLLDHYLGWRSIFWFLAIFSGITFLVIATFLPETNRRIVGNGSLPPQPWNRSLLGFYRQHCLKRKGSKAPSHITTPQTRKPLSLVQSLYIFKDKESCLLLVYAGLFFASFYLVIATLPALLESKYHLNSLQIGLCFIAMGAGSITANLINARFMDWNFRRHATKAGITIDKNKQQNLRYLQIERIRLEIVLPIIFACCAVAVAYGFVIQHAVYLAAPLILLYLIGTTLTCAFQGLSALIVDLNRDTAGSASAAMNLSRCLLGAGASALAVPLEQAVGMGWTSVLAVAVWLAIAPVIPWLIRKGPQWREEKRLKGEMG